MPPKKATPVAKASSKPAARQPAKSTITTAKKTTPAKPNTTGTSKGAAAKKTGTAPVKGKPKGKDSASPKVSYFAPPFRYHGERVFCLLKALCDIQSLHIKIITKHDLVSIK